MRKGSKWILQQTYRIDKSFIARKAPVWMFFKLQLLMILIEKKNNVSGSNIIIWVNVFCGITVPSSINVGDLVVLTGKSYNKINGLEHWKGRSLVVNFNVVSDLRNFREEKLLSCCLSDKKSCLKTSVRIIGLVVMWGCTVNINEDKRARGTIQLFTSISKSTVIQLKVDFNCLVNFTYVRTWIKLALRGQI